MNIGKYIAYDKALHFVAGSFVSVFGLFISPELAIVLLLAAAVGREIYNAVYGGTVSVADIAWTVAGGIPPFAGYFLGAEHLF